MKTSIFSRNVECDALAPHANNGYVNIYSGSQPATTETAASGTLLAQLRLNATAFGAAVDGVLTANTLTADSTADATGTAGYFRVLKSDGTTVLWDGSVGTSGSDLNLNSTAIQAGANVSISSLTYTLPT